jgi:hypothetical protein
MIIINKFLDNKLFNIKKYLLMILYFDSCYDLDIYLTNLCTF